MALIVLCWTGQLDQLAQDKTQANFTRSLTVAALARAMNGVISVAQGTEVAIQPVGVGVTLTLGEILDPLNDLVERFSWLALLASISLGLQLTAHEMISSVWMSGATTALLALFIIGLWWRSQHPLTLFLARATVVFVGARFLLAFVLLISAWLDATFLTERTNEAIEQLSYTTTSLEQMNESTTSTELGVTEEDESLFERTSAQLRGLLESSRQTLDLRAQLEQLQTMSEESVEQIINLIVIFLLQTIILPLGTAWLVWQILRRAFQRIFGVSQS